MTARSWNTRLDGALEEAEFEQIIYFFIFLFILYNLFIFLFFFIILKKYQMNCCNFSAMLVVI